MKRIKLNPPLPHGYDGTFEEIEREVDNPHAALQDPNRDPDLPPESKTIKLKGNGRETPIEHMFSRGEIDERLKRAADVFRVLIECFPLSGGVIDPAKIRVDMSGASFEFSNRALDAGRKLLPICERLGKKDYRMLWLACSVGWTISRIAPIFYPGYREEAKLGQEIRRHIGRRLKDSLDEVAKHFELPHAKERSVPRRAQFYRAFSADEVK